MRDEIKEYEAVARAAENFVKSVAGGNSSYARKLFTDFLLLLKLNGEWKCVTCIIGKLPRFVLSRDSTNAEKILLSQQKQKKI